MSSLQESDLLHKTSGEHIKEEPKTPSPEESIQQTPDKEPSPRTVHGWKWFLVCVGMYMSGLIYGLDTTIAADVQGAVVERFNDVSRLTWMGTAFPLGSVCAVLPAGAFYANFDLKKLYIISVIIFEVGSVLCAAAPNMDCLIVGRAIAGLGGSGVFIGILNFYSLTTTQAERGPYIGVIGLVWGVGSVLGPVVGGAFSVSSATWRWAFYMNLLIAAVLAPVYIFLLPSVKPAASEKPVLKRLVNMDWFGFTFFTGAIVTFVLALTFAGTIWAWNDGRTIACFVVAGVLAIAMLLQQYFVLFTNREVRMFPPKATLTDYTSVLLNFVTGAAAANIYVPLYYIPVYCQFVHGDTAIWAAVRLLPYICFLAVFNMLSGFYFPKFKYYWAVYFIAGLLMTAGGATMFTVNQNLSIGNLYGYSILLGAGTGLVFNAGYTVGGIKTMIRTGSTLDVQHFIAMLNLTQLSLQMGSLLIGGQIFQSIARDRLTTTIILSGENNLNKTDIASIIAGTQSLLYQQLSPELREQCVAAITLAISRVYIISFTAGAVTVVSALFMKKEPLFPRETPAAVEDMVLAGGA